MSNPNRFASSRMALVLVLVLSLCLPATARADGGPVVHSHVWEWLSEGQQIAVVTLDQTDTARVDLFISLLDSSGESHEVTFFLPLGVEAASFDVKETRQSRFEEEATFWLDYWIQLSQRKASRLQNTRLLALAFGWLTINAGCVGPIVGVIVNLVGCATVAPVATFETPSSRLEIYDLDQDTDLEALLLATGLDPAVQETLARLRGQQIAVIELQTQATRTGGQGSGSSNPMGLHLSWQTALVPGERGSTYAYPLGTGAAWAHPIGITRVYVVGDGTDFEVEYPRLGRNLSGYALWGGIRASHPRIEDADEPCYAVERTFGGTNYWKVTYLQSNAAEDITITRIAGLSTRTRVLQRRARWRTAATVVALLIGLLGTLFLWSVAWRLGTARVLAIRHKWWSWAHWRGVLGWGYLPTIGAVAASAVFYGGLYAVNEWLSGSWYDADLLVPGLGWIWMTPWVLAIVSSAAAVAVVRLLVRRRAKRLEVFKKRAWRAYIASLVFYSLFYLPLAFGFALATRAL